jgi:CHASE2 domain-containing sensor protein
MELFKLLFSPIEPGTRFKAIVVHSTVGERDDESLLPFVDEGKDWRTTLIKILESVAFNPKDFQQFGEQEWMEKVGLLTEDRQTFHPDLLKNIGQTLYQSLFPRMGKLESLLKSALRSAESNNTDLHIQLTFQEDSVRRSRFADYPWELLHDGKKFLAHRRVTFSRYIGDELVPPNLPATEKINVLLVSSAAFDADEGLKKLSKQEQQAVLHGLEKSQHHGHVKLTQLEYASIQCLRTYLTDHQGADSPHVLHFDGHGLYGKRCPNQQCRAIHKGTKVVRCKNCNTLLPSESQGYLVFETEQGAPDYVSAEELGLLLQTATATDAAIPSHGITLAVLSACQSGMSVIGDSMFNGTAQNLISHRVPAVVAMQYSVSVDGATKFTEQFYRSLGRKNSLALAVNQGREAMGLSTQQWFRPVLYLRWADNSEGQIFNISPRFILRHLSRRSLLGVSSAMTAMIFFLRFLGFLEAVELKTYDHLLWMRFLDENSDSRLLIVKITDEDLTAQVKRNEPGQGTIKEPTLNRILENLEKFQPRLIGFDLYRDFEAAKSQPILASRLKSDRLFSVCKITETDEKGDVKRPGIAPPPEVALERVGFSDFIPDHDQVLRRFLIAQDTEVISNPECMTRQSFSLALARRYLQLEDSSKYRYQDPFVSGSVLKIGNVDFNYIQPFTGGYQDLNASGYQILLNYRAIGRNPEAIAKTKTLEDVLNNRISEKDVRDKIILIGITAKVAISDDWLTPYGVMSGVTINAHMISQILSAAEGKRALLSVWPLGIEFLWILIWSIISAELVYYFRLSWRNIAIVSVIGLSILYFCCLVFLTWGSLWIPLIPPVLAFIFTGCTTLYIVYHPNKKANSIAKS